MKLLELIKNPFKKKKADPRVTDKDKEAFAKIILGKKNGDKKVKYVPIQTYEIKGVTYKIGDKVICRSNEPYPLLIGKIIEFWDNEGKWSNAVPVVRNLRTGKRFNVHGVIQPYSEELMSKLRPMKPLEQWNYLVPEEVRYTQEEMDKKEVNFKMREKSLPTKK